MTGRPLNFDEIETIKQDVGFRTVEIKDAQLLVNGQYVYLKGTNLHEHHDVNGHVMDEATMLKDILLMMIKYQLLLQIVFKMKISFQK